ncbi:MAG TPA: response regulator [Candidatus Angelobacter sp.]|jgi:CheY-like chemotaxis protein
MMKVSECEILVVDDDTSVLRSITMLLQMSGYNVTTASNGFEALLQLKKKLPSIVLSDLNMPEMSGFELLSVVRRRFPELLVIAMSGGYQTADAVPGGAIADAFYAKGNSNPETLLSTVAALFASSAPGAVKNVRKSSPVWVPRNNRNSQGVPYLVVTCTECLRSFPLTVEKEDSNTIQETACLFCANTVSYMVDYSPMAGAPYPGAVQSSGLTKKAAR